jgi:hypothetical protein
MAGLQAFKAERQTDNLAFDKDKLLNQLVTRIHE